MRASALHVDEMATPGIGLGDLGLLPEDFLEFVILRLDNRSILRLSAASSNLREICQQEPIWQRICMRDACGQLQYKVCTFVCLYTRYAGFTVHLCQL